MNHRSASVFAVFVLLAGCARHHGSAESPAIRLATTRGGLPYLPVYLAKALGYYDQEGIAVSLDEVVSASKAMQSLIGGSSDVATGGFMSVVRMNAERRPIQAFFVLVRYPADVGMVSPRAHREIRRIEDLDGATVGVAGVGSDEDMAVRFVCSRHGVDPARVKTVSLGAGMSKVLALEQGSVDVISAIGTAASLIQKRHPNVSILFDLRSREGVQKELGVEDVASTVLYAKVDWISAHRESVARIVRATSRASEWARSHSAGEIRGFLSASMRTDDAAVDADAIGSMVAAMSTDGKFRPEHLDVAREILTVSDPSLRIRTADVSQSYTNEFFKPEVR